MKPIQRIFQVPPARLIFVRRLSYGKLRTSTIFNRDEIETTESVTCVTNQQFLSNKTTE